MANISKKQKQRHHVRYNKRKQVNPYIDLNHSRVHKSELALCVIFPSKKTKYDNLNKSESQMLTDLMTKVYDIYQPAIVSINCGHKTNNRSPQIHWLFEFKKSKFLSNLNYIARKASDKQYKLLQTHIKHFNNKYHQFSNHFKLKNYSYIQKDIQLYKKISSLIIQTKIGEQQTDFNGIEICDLFDSENDNNNHRKRYPNKNKKHNNNQHFNHRNTSLFLTISLNQNHKYFKAYNYRKQIDNALQKLKTFIHNSAQLVITFIKHEIGSVSKAQYQALEWFELSVTHSKHVQQILIRCTVTIFHFMFILYRNCKIYNDSILINTWFDTYCKFVEKKCKVLKQYKKISCDYNNHHVLNLNHKFMQIKRLSFIGNGSKNSKLNVDTILQTEYKCNSKQILNIHCSEKKQQIIIKQQKSVSKAKEDNKLQLKRAINDILNYVGDDMRWNNLTDELKKYESSL
eukprot:444605_1